MACRTRSLAAPPEEAAELLSPYLEVVGALNERGRLRLYPGSPALIRAWLRPKDRLIACELEPRTAAALTRNLRGDARIKTLSIDGWTALSAYVPPIERRGLVLVDPPFEAERIPTPCQWLEAAHRSTTVRSATQPGSTAQE
jgi:23S rRNA (adenine2030-N6)-methyltransferase